MCNKSDLKHEFEREDFKKMHGNLGIRFYEECSITDEKKEFGPLEILKKFVREELYAGQKLPEFEGTPADNPVCQCRMM